MKSIRTSRSRFVAAAAGAAGVAILPHGLRAAQFEFRCGTNLPADNPAVPGMLQMWAAIERESGGRIHTDFFPASSLGTEEAMFSQLRIGALHFQLLTPGILASVVPVADIAFLGFAFTDAEQGSRTLDGPLGGYIHQEALAKNLVTLKTTWETGMFQVGSATVPIRTPDDMHGFKPRVSGSRIAVDFFKELGASPTTLSFVEVYTGLKTRLVDGTTSPLITVEAARWYENLKYISLTNHGWVGNFLIANPDVWKNLGPELQAIVERNNTKYAILERKAARELTSSLSAKLRSQGLTVNSVNQAPFQARLKSYYGRWAETFGPTAWNLLETSIGRKLA